MNIFKQAVFLKRSIFLRPYLLENHSFYYFSGTERGPIKGIANNIKYKSDKSTTNQHVEETFKLRTIDNAKNRFFIQNSFKVDEELRKLAEISKENDIKQDNIMDILLQIKIDQIQKGGNLPKNIKYFISKDLTGEILKNRDILRSISVLYNIPTEYKTDYQTANIEIRNKADLFGLTKLYPKILVNYTNEEKGLSEKEIEYISLLKNFAIKSSDQILPENKGFTNSSSNSSDHSQSINIMNLNSIQLLKKMNSNLAERSSNSNSERLKDDIRTYWYIVLNTLDVSSITINKKDCTNLQSLYLFWLNNTKDINSLDGKILYAISELILRGLAFNKELITDHYFKLIDDLIDAHSKIVASNYKFFSRENFHQKIIEIVSAENLDEKNIYQITNLLKSISKLSLGTKQFFAELENRLISSENRLNPKAKVNIAISLVRASSGRKFIKNFLESLISSKQTYDLKDQARIIFLMAHSNIIYDELINRYESNFTKYCKESSVDDVIMFVYSLVKSGMKDRKILNDVFAKIETSKIEEIHPNKMVPLFWSYNICERYNAFFSKILKYFTTNYKEINRETLFQFVEAFFNLNPSIKKENNLNDAFHKEFISFLISNGIQENSENLRKPKALDTSKKNIITLLSKSYPLKLNVWYSGFFFDAFIPSLKFYIDFDDQYSHKQNSSDYIGSISWKKKKLEENKDIKYIRLTMANVSDINSDPNKLDSVLGINS